MKHDMEGMAMASPPNPAIHRHHHMMMHMTFYWGKNGEVLFSGWPGYDNLGMYILALIVVFFMAVFIEWLSHCNYYLIKENNSRSNHLAAGMGQTVLYGLRIGSGYMVMLAVMSFNTGIFLVAVFGYMLGFFFFGSRVFNKDSLNNTSDLPPMNCC
ncbi:hypothetical protein M9H77_06029 [Catharanthus roseus]|uniref:Uncharacterized protein n=1 Tax=Catharanthus roseus TaxID=4058 RepID=A0ACC0BR10_CATRO|nr:hypothetical protein M9H77_06029 [Catharanthus roseus]